MRRPVPALAFLVIPLFAAGAASAEEPPPKEAPKEAPKEKDEDPQVTLVVTTDNARVHIEKRANVVEGWQTTLGIPVFTVTEQWEPACAAPCNIHSSPHVMYRVSGRGVATSSPFLLPKGDPVHLDVHAKSAFWMGAGVASAFVGGILVGTGAVSTLVAGNITSTDAEAQVRGYGIAFLIGGAVLLGAGIVLWATGSSTVRTADGHSL